MQDTCWRHVVGSSRLVGERCDRLQAGSVIAAVMSLTSVPMVLIMGKFELFLCVKNCAKSSQ